MTVYTQRCHGQPSSRSVAFLHQVSQAKPCSLNPADHQLNGNDCGLFALAFCTALCRQGPTRSSISPKGNASTPAQVLNTRTHGAIPMQRHYPNCSCEDLPNSHLLHLSYPRSRQHGGMQRCGEWYHQECARVPEHVWKKGSIPWVCRYCS